MKDGTVTIPLEDFDKLREEKVASKEVVLLKNSEYSSLLKEVDFLREQNYELKEGLVDLRDRILKDLQGEDGIVFLNNEYPSNFFPLQSIYTNTPNAQLIEEVSRKRLELAKESSQKELDKLDDMWRTQERVLVKVSITIITVLALIIFWLI